MKGKHRATGCFLLSDVDLCKCQLGLTCFLDNGVQNDK